MKREIVADVNQHEVRVALLEDRALAEIQVELRGNERLVGNIYKGRVANILPGMQAAFIDIGSDKNAFLYAGDILADKSDFEFTGTDNSVEGKLQSIGKMLKKGQEIMVQVLKQPGGTKGARVTTHVTLPGRLMVLMPTVDHIGVSRKIEDEAERERLKNIMAELKPKDMGIIVRTAAVGTTKEKLAGEVDFLVRFWGRIQKKARLVAAPRLIHSEETLLFRTVRDMFTKDVESFIINDREYYEKVLTIVEITLPALVNRVKLYDKKTNIFDDYAIESKIEKALSKKAWMDNGSYLIIDETEALTVIDVNTGKYIGEDDLQQTILNTNVAAAKEIARQLRLRDIGGIVVIDFIDMDNNTNEDIVVETLREALRQDRTKTNVLGFTGLGLVEMTRKKVRRRLSALLQSACPDCGGSGRIYSPPAMAMKIRREVNRFVLSMDAQKYIIEAAPEIVQYIEACNDRNMSVLCDYPGKTFYISANKSIGRQSCKISMLSDTILKDGCIKDARVFF